MVETPIWILSVWQPWAWLIVRGDKDVENRIWQTNFRGTFCVHASQKIDVLAVAELTKRGVKLPRTYETGGIVGTADIVDCQIGQRCRSHWAQPDGYCFVLRERRATKFIPCPGNQKFFKATPDVIRALIRNGVKIKDFEDARFMSPEERSASGSERFYASLRTRSGSHR